MKKPKLSIILVILFTTITAGIAYLSMKLPDLFDSHGEMFDDEDEGLF